VTRTFEDKPAKREKVPLLVGLMGPSGSGKTYSALRLARGIQEVSGGDIFVIDTEAKRSLHYADKFEFRHIDFGAPFGSLDYLASLEHCVRKGAGVVVVDSMSHEHEGPGGYLLTQEEELQRMAGDDYRKREQCKMAAWIKPAAARKRFINGLLQLNSNFIFCFRAKEKVKPKKDDRGKTQIVDMGFMPIAGEEFLFEMTMNCLLLPKSDGVPTWRSDAIGERLMMKCPTQFRDLMDNDQQLDETVGRALAKWAAGGAAPAPVEKATDEGLIAEGKEAAERGSDALRAFWGRLRPAEKHAAGGAKQLEEWRAIAALADDNDAERAA
jgi:energy-coupling factor transporter ATP-binding protein EcfA2